MRIRTKIYFGYAILIVILVITALVNWYTRHMFLKDAELTRDVAYEIDHINTLSLSVLQLVMPANDFLSTGDEQEKKNFLRLKEKVRELLRSPHNGAFNDSEIHEVLIRNVQKIEELSNRIFALKATGSREGTKLMYEVDVVGNQTVEIVQEYNLKRHEKLDALHAKARANMRILNIVTSVGWTLLILAGLVIIYYFNRNLQRPIEKLNRGFQGVSHGRWNHVSLDQNDELADLAKEFNTMIERMSSSYEELENEVRSRTAELFELNKRLESLAITDGLSGLFNHRHFYERLHQEYNRALRYNRPLTVLMIDIDYFKQYNDANGHMAGDKVIMNVAKILLKESRKSDIVARYGGEEFVIISPELDEAQSIAFAERLRTGVERFKFTNGKTQPNGSVTISIGIVLSPDISVDPESFLKKADLALYQAKRAGRNQTVVYKGPVSNKAIAQAKTRAKVHKKVPAKTKAKTQTRATVPKTVQKTVPKKVNKAVKKA